MWTSCIWRSTCSSGRPMVDGSELGRPACRLCDRGCHRMINKIYIHFIRLPKFGNTRFPEDRPDISKFAISTFGKPYKMDIKIAPPFFLSLSCPSNNVRSSYYHLSPSYISNRYHSCPGLHSDRRRARCPNHSPHSFPSGFCGCNVCASRSRKQSSSYKSPPVTWTYLWSLAIACRCTAFRPSADPFHKSPNLHSSSQRR